VPCSPISFITVPFCYTAIVCLNEINKKKKKKEIKKEIKKERKKERKKENK